MGSHNNRYDDEFKTSAVKLVLEKDRTISAVAKDLGISQPALRLWVKASTEPEDATTKRLAELEAENKKLKKQLDNANDTVEILKKSVAIFVKPQN
ncbi:Transposase [Sporotomaculum syntrophicum]|uniref:Transposase n=1 Tax=Sporotomaculum syntrophicum TaxID=182264 RepID=A0A9D2WN64_9FIRM|nr:transposase [Sporotomaculum syntrophicum]KAF1084278.1 Transposase [Sporotomaculum syntrophicum]